MQLDYTRDAAGQVTAITGIEEPTGATGTETFTIDPASNRMTVAGANNLTHDASGNLISDGVRTFTWDALNRLVKVEQGGTVVATYGYDSQNRRIRKTVGSQTTLFCYDLNNQLIAETTADGTVLREYISLDGEPLAVREYQGTAGLYYYANDHLGTPQQLIKPDGTVVWKAAYLPYGQAWVRTETVANNLRFPGQYFDAETGLHYNLNRYYDSDTGRYISADPLGLDGGMNLYAYVQNDPVNWIDPEGLSGSKPGGPYHPPSGVSFGCKSTDSCAMIKAKIWVIERMLYSHMGWDIMVEAPRGGNRHAEEIRQLFGALAKCEKFKNNNCDDDCGNSLKSANPSALPIPAPIFAIP